MNIRSIKAVYGPKAFDPAPKTKKKGPAEKNSTASGERVAFSDTSQNLNKLHEIVDSIPEVRIKMVEDIQTKIKYNGYPLESNLYKALERLINNKIV